MGRQFARLILHCSEALAMVSILQAAWKLGTSSRDSYCVAAWL